MTFLEGMVMLLVGLWLIRRIGRVPRVTRPSIPDPDLACRLKIAELKFLRAIHGTPGHSGISEIPFGGTASIQPGLYSARRPSGESLRKWCEENQIAWE